MKTPKLVCPRQKQKKMYEKRKSSFLLHILYKNFCSFIKKLFISLAHQEVPHTVDASKVPHTILLPHAKL
jgi:hypothetical protein